MGISRGLRVVAAAVAAAFALVAVDTVRQCAGEPAAANAQDGTDAIEAREWNQPGGGPTHACATTVAPVRGEPRIAWRQQLPGPVLAEPVCWAGVVYVVAQRGRGRELYAFRGTTGEKLGTKPLGEGAAPVVAVWQGTAVVVDDTKVRGFPLRGDGFGMGWTATNALVAAPPRLALTRGTVFVETSDGCVAIAANNGKILGSVPGSYGDRAAPAAVADAQGVTIVRAVESTKPDYSNSFVGVESAVVTGVGGREIQVKDWDRTVTDLVVKGTWDSNVWCAWFPGQGPFRDGAANGLLFLSGLTFPTSTGGATPAALVGQRLRPVLSDIATRPASVGGKLYGFSKAGALIEMAFDGKYRVLVEAGKLPAGAHPGPATLAQDVLCFGNWAVEIATRRVLWCRKDVVPATPAVPVSDGRLVVGTTTGEIVCLEDASIPATAPPVAGGAATQPGTSGADSPAAARPRAPTDLAGVLLADGTRFDGKAERLEGDSIRVTPPKGDPRTLRADEVCLAVADGKVIFRGGEFGAFAAWRDAIEDEAVSAYTDLFRKASSENLLRLAREYLTRARAFGVADADAEKLDRLLTGKSEHPNANLKSPRFERLDAEVRGRLAARCLEASAWLAERELATAATAVLDVGLRVSPGRSDLLARAQALVPLEYPWPDAKDRGAAWLRWAAELIPAEAAFVAPVDAVWGRVAREPAWAKGTIALRSRNLLFFSRTADPAVVGACMRNGEGAIHALDALLRDGLPTPVAGDRDRLEVRLHADRAGYLAERPPSGGKAMTWSAGYFSPAENVSRFYVPGGDETAAARGRTLSKTLAHELTHHYVSQRWAGGRAGGAAQPGYWIVEGLARFVEDQSVEMGRRGLRFDDPTVESLDTASQLDGQRALFAPLGKFLDMSHAQFAMLDTKPLGRVKLRNTLVTYDVDALQVFYEQAGSVCFWLMHHRGPEGRAALMRYVRAHYDGKLGRDSWKTLGFSDAAAMEKEFRAFLATLRT